MKYASAVRVRVKFDKELVGTAIQWTGRNAGNVTDFLGYMDRNPDGRIVILTSEGAMAISEGDWLVKLDEGGELVAPCTDKVFDAVFEEFE